MTPHQILSAFRNDGSHEHTLLDLFAKVERLRAKFYAERAKVASLEAEATRWREVAGELAGALGDAFQHGEIMTSERRMNRCGAALTRFKQENDQ
jgi:hypothetical protein